MSEKKVEILIQILKNLVRELKKDPDLASRLLSGTEPDKTPADQVGEYPKLSESIDLFKIFRTEGKDSLKRLLDDSDIKALKMIIISNRLDPSGKSLKWKKKDKLIELICERIGEKIFKGDSFMR